MPVTVVHQTAATQPDSADGKISSNAWNEEHTLTGLGTMAEADAADYYTAAETDAAIAAAGGGGGSVTLDQVTLDFGSTPVWSKGFTFALTGATSGQALLMQPSGESDEYEMDGFACAAKGAGVNSVTAYIQAIPGPVTGTRVFNVLRG